jgi:hypothetical protein
MCRPFMVASNLVSEFFLAKIEPGLSMQDQVIPKRYLSFLYNLANALSFSSRAIPPRIIDFVATLLNVVLCKPGYRGDAGVPRPEGVSLLRSFARQCSSPPVGGRAIGCRFVHSFLIRIVGEPAPQASGSKTQRDLRGASSLTQPFVPVGSAL